ncbi:MAG: S9 family peptidase [Gemmatimonadetes bacterium]|nr:S9 family peptidase [Gemmatimonadota bacterium]
MHRLASFLRAALLFAACLAPALGAQAYKQPPAPIAQILDAPATPAVQLSPDRATLLLLERPGLPSIADVSAPELRLAGIRFDPSTSGPTRENNYTAMSLMTVATGATRKVAMTLGTGASIANVQWAPGAQKVAFTVTSGGTITLWVADLASASARQVSARPLNGVLGAPCDWVDAARLACRFVPEGRGAAPPQGGIPAGPIEQESMSGKAERAATYQDLLKSPTDEKLFEHFATSQLALVSLDGRLTKLGAPEMLRRVDASPDGRYLLVDVIHRPFSYQVPLQYFPTRSEVRDLNGTVVKLVIDRPLVERVPWRGDATIPGPRSATWRADVPSTLAWIEALDGGDPEVKTPKRDRLLLLDAPFSGAARTLVETEWRANGVVWGKGDLAIATESQQKERKVRQWVIDPSLKAAPRLLWERSSEDRYGNPGTFVTTRNANGRAVLLLSPDGGSAYLNGDGASAEGDRPFADKLDLASGKATRLFQSQAPYFEQPVAWLDDRGSRLITRRESRTDVPNYWTRDLVRRMAPVQLTKFADPAPQFAGVTSQLITYTRADGVKLSATVYLPPGYDKAKDGPLPFFLWAYPLEYRSREAASQVVGSPYRFVRPTGASHLFLLTQGYGVMDNPTMPIVGENGKEPNDTYVEQLVASAQAAVDTIVAMGVADRGRIGVGGHSYGAFMTANLLAHTRLFKAGIARSGAYNRTLTPFGFQGEDRSYWDATELYTAMSPFTNANKIKDPILLIHGMADDNTGTYPIQSERMYAALKGNGATVRYVQLPAEAHGYRARESVGHTLAEMVGWLDRFVKPRKPNA